MSEMLPYFLSTWKESIQCASITKPKDKNSRMQDLGKKVEFRFKISGLKFLKI